MDIAAIGPGYDDSAVYNREPHSRRDRLGGKLYRSSFEAVFAGNRHILAIETWNEYHEATGVASSYEYGDT